MFNGTFNFLDGASDRIWYHIFLDTLAPTPVRLSVSDTFRFSFCQRLWDLTKRRDDIATKKRRSWCMHENEFGVCTKRKLTYAWKRKQSVLGRSWLMRSVPGLRVFKALWVYLKKVSCVTKAFVSGVARMGRGRIETDFSRETCFQPFLWIFNFERERMWNCVE